MDTKNTIGLEKVISEDILIYILKIITSAFRFSELILISPEAAAPHLANFITAFIGLFIFIRFIGKILDAASGAFAMLKDIFIQLADVIRMEIRNFLKITIQNIFSRSTYISIIEWCAMLTTENKKELSGKSGGEEVINSQKNLGLAALLVSIWAGLAFFYAVYSSAKSFEEFDVMVFWVAIVGAPIYGLLILCLDRSIIAIANDDEKPQNQGWNLYIDILFSLLKFFARLFVSWKVAHFTAIPFTMLILSGGISEIQNTNYEQKRVAYLGRVTGAEKVYADSAKEKIDSDVCKNSKSSLADIIKLRSDEAKICPKPGAVCLGKNWTRADEAVKNAKELEEISCTLDVNTVNILKNSIATAQKELENLKRISSPDVLSGSIILEDLKKKYANSFFDPVASIFYFLFIIELIPVLIKTWTFTIRRSAA